MSFIGELLGGYKPNGAFSFELFKRDRGTGQASGEALMESFFLLAPEEYTMEEGYKTNVTKTIGGAFVDDFGNDIKKITLQGSIYSFYFGIPETAKKGTGSFLKDAGQTALRRVQDIGTKITQNLPQFFPPPFSGITGVDEWFKLRYIVSRFRDISDLDKAVKNKSSQTNKLIKKFPEIKKLFAGADNNKLNNYEDLLVVYHDYDDSNHFEIVFTDFKHTRSKDDPFTIKYTLEFICLEEKTADIPLSSKLGLNPKPPFLEAVRGFNDAMNETFNDLEDISTLGGLPITFQDTGVQLINSAQNIISRGQQLQNKTTKEWERFVSVVTGENEKITKAKAEFVSAVSGQTIADLANEDFDLDEDQIVIYNTLNQTQVSYTNFQGLGAFAKDTQDIKTFESNDEPEINTEDFPIDQTDESDSQLKELQDRKFVYYVVDQNDTLFVLANKFYNDYRKASIIGQSNGLVNSDFFEDALVGTTIRIPLLNEIQNLGQDNNLVFSRITGLTPPRQRQIQVLGTDMRLSSNRGIVADGTGDLGLLYGEDTYLANLIDRLSFSRGSLGPVNPTWGMPTGIGQVPENIQLEKLIEIVEAQALADPRTEFAFVDREKVDLTGDVLTIPLVTKPVTGEETTLDVGKILPDVFS